MDSENTQQIRSRSAGGIVIGDGGQIALVRTHGRSQWLFPKGTIEEGETHEEAARREIEEEAGLKNLEYLDDLGTYVRSSLDENGNEVQDTLKEIHMFLFATEPHAEPRGSMEIEEARWFPYRELAQHIGYDKDRAWFATVFDRVREAIQRD